MLTELVAAVVDALTEIAEDARKNPGYTALVFFWLVAMVMVFLFFSGHL